MSRVDFLFGNMWSYVILYFQIYTVHYLPVTLSFEEQHIQYLESELFIECFEIEIRVSYLRGEVSSPVPLFSVYSVGRHCESYFWD